MQIDEAGSELNKRFWSSVIQELSYWGFKEWRLMDNVLI